MSELADFVDVGPLTPPMAWDAEQDVSTITLSDVDGPTATVVPQLAPAGQLTAARTVFEGDVVFARIRPALDNGKLAIAEGLRDGAGLVSAELLVLRPKPGVPAEWVRAFLRRSAVREHLIRQAVGTTRPRIRPTDLESLPLSAPPPAAALERVLEAQRRIDALSAHAATMLTLSGRLPAAIARDAGARKSRRPLADLASVDRGSIRIEEDDAAHDRSVANVDARYVMGWLNRSSAAITRWVSQPDPELLLEPDDLLLPMAHPVARAGQGILWAEHATVDGPATFSSKLLRVRARDHPVGALLWAWLQGAEARALLGDRPLRNTIRVPKAALEALPVPDLPGVELRRFDSAARAALRLRATALHHATLVESLRQAHLAEVFPGPLSAPETAVEPGERTAEAEQPASTSLDTVYARLSAGQQTLWAAVHSQTGAFTLDDLVEGEDGRERARRALRLFERLGLVIAETNDDVTTLRQFDPDIDDDRVS